MNGRFTARHSESLDIGPTQRLRGMALTEWSVDDLAIAEIYEEPLVLVRPDGHVTWRGDEKPGGSSPQGWRTTS